MFSRLHNEGTSLGADRELYTILTDSRLRWPGTFAQGPMERSS